MRPLIIAHRGASRLAPENTLAAFRAAGAAGADGIEIDVQMTRDQKLVIAHDFITDRVANVHYDIFDTDFDTLRELDFGIWKGLEFAGEKIPTLEEVLDISRDMKMIHVELKPYFDRDKDFVDRVLDTIVDMGFEDKVVITSFQYDLLRQVKERMPQIRTNALFLNMESLFLPPVSFWESLGLTNGDPLLEKLPAPQDLNALAALAESPDELDGENGILYQTIRDRLLALLSNYPKMNLLQILEDYVRQADVVRYVSQFDFPVDFVGTSFTTCLHDPKLISRLHANGYQAAPWPMFAESRRELRSLIRMQPDVILTDEPEMVLSVIEEEERSHEASSDTASDSSSSEMPESPSAEETVPNL